MKQKLNNILPKSEFAKNVLTLMTGTLVAQAIPIAISPVLTRIYTPDDFGVLALFVAITSILGTIATGRYEMAIMLPEKDEDAVNILALSFVINLTISISSFIIVLLFGDLIVNLLGNTEIKFWLYFAPLVIFLTGVFSSLYYFNNRIKKYKDLRNATVIRAVALSVCQISIGFLKQGVTGLISGQIISSFFANIKLLKNITNNKILLKSISKENIKKQAVRYKKFPQYLMLAHGVNSLSGQSHIILFTSFFSASLVGFLSLAQKLLGMPTQLVAKSIGDVFLQKATVEYRDKKECVALYKNTLKKLIILSILPFIVLFFIAPSLFAFVFGEPWRVSGEYVQVLIPMYFLQFVTTPLSNMFLVSEKQSLDLYWQIYRLVVAVVAIAIGYFVFNDAYITVILFSLAHSSAYLINTVFTYNFAKGK